ncbi:MAG: hypothetical protein JWM88_2264 [Verrucomicrobia bacterium]|nr:hypothetical protein [Verrucomicrobiota bacterium]
MTAVPPASRPFFPWRRAILTAAAVVAVLFLRRPEVFRHPQFWAEDGAIFFVQADVLGARAIAQSYGGYHLFLPRLVAAAASALDPRWIPAVYFWSSIAMVAGVTFVLFSPRLELRHPVLCALALVLVPHSGEAFQSLTNAQWVLAMGLILLLVARDPERPVDGIVDVAIALFVGLTGVFSILFAPLFLLRAALRRSRASWLLAAVVAGAASLQFFTYRHAGLPESTSRDPAGGLVRVVALRTWGSLLLPPPKAEAAATGWLAAGAFLATVGLAGVGMRDPASRTTRLMLWGAIAMTLGVIVYKFRRDSGVLFGLGNGDRYFFGAKVLLLWLLVLGWDGPLRWFVRIACGVVICASLSAFRFVPYEDYHWPEWAARIRAGEHVTVPINPPGSGFEYPGRRK